MRWTSVHHQNYHSGVKNQKYIRCLKYYTYYNFWKKSNWCGLNGIFIFYSFEIIIHFFILKQVTNSPDQLLCLIVHQHASNSKGKETWTRIRDHWRKFGMEPTSNYYECCASTYTGWCTKERHSMMSTLKISGFEQMMSHPFHRPKNRHIIVEL